MFDLTLHDQSIKDEYQLIEISEFVADEESVVEWHQFKRSIDWLQWQLIRFEIEVIDVYIDV